MQAITNPQLFIPKSISSDFAAQFSKLALDLGAFPINIRGVANIGTGETPEHPLPPLIAIDGSARPSDAPPPEPKDELSQRTLGFESDLGRLHDLLDMHPTTFLREFNISAKDLDWAHQKEPLSQCPTMRHILATSEASTEALIFFAPAFTQLVKKFVATSARYAASLTGTRFGEERPSIVPLPPKRPSVEKANDLEFAMQRFLHAALLARTGQDAQLIKARGLFLESAKLFVKVEHFPAAAMMLEHARTIQARKGRAPDTIRHEEATQWLNALNIISERDLGFETMYHRALNAAQYEPAGSGMLEAIFRSSATFLNNSGKKDESLNMFIRETWARLMKTEDLTPQADTLVDALKRLKEPPPPSTLDVLDWSRLHINFIAIGDYLKTHGDLPHAEIAADLTQMTRRFAFAEESSAAEKKRNGSAPA